jgi:hypothetical protein
MEAVLDTYERPYDPLHPVVCLDEYPLALTAWTRPAIPASPGQPEKVDYEYRRCGSCSLFAVFQPLTGWRSITAREHRTAQDFAHILKPLVDEHFPTAEQITVVLDNLNTHHLHTLYQTFEPDEAARIARKLVFVHTPVHGSWLNMVEIEWSILARTCLRGRRFPDLVSAQRELDAWVAERNARRATIRWRFTSRDARIRLRHLYPIPTSSMTESP